MIKKIKNDIIRVLNKTVDLVQKKDYAGIMTWSDHVIRNASAYQDDDSLSVAVFVYALGKVLQRCCEKGEPVPNLAAKTRSLLKHMKNDDDNAFRAELKALINSVGKFDKQLKMYIQEVITKAKIKKASRIHKHGISIARTSELLGVSQWELQDYIGHTIGDDKYRGMNVLDRLKTARKVNSLAIDAGPIIAIAANHVLWLFKHLKQVYKGPFFLPIGVKQELVDKPLGTRRFKLEAIQLQSLIEKGVFDLVDDEAIIAKARELLNIANNILFYNKNNIRIVQLGEMEVIATAIIKKVDAIAIDERVTRTLIEEPNSLKKLMEGRMHRHLDINKNNLERFKKEVKGLKVIRSIEIITIAFENGLLDKFIVDIPNAKRELLESLLWGMKTEGCSVTEKEINEIVKNET
jgi:hypothetical protein